MDQSVQSVTSSEEGWQRSILYLKNFTSQEQEDINLWLYLYIISTLSVTCFHLNTGKSFMCDAAPAWWHRSRHHLSLWPAHNETNFADSFNLQYAATPAMWDESMQGTEPACLPSVIRVNRMSKLKSHTGARWTEYSRWKSLLICILICWEQNYLGARPDDAGTMLSMDGPPTDDPTELLLLLYTPKRRQTL